MNYRETTIALLCFINICHAETIISPTFPGTNIPDKSKPALVQDGNIIYESHPATTIRDYSKPAYVRENNGDGTSTIYEAHPSSNLPNKVKGGYLIQDNKE